MPKGSHLDLTDPYADKSAARRRRLAIFGVLFTLLAVAAGFAWYAKVWPFDAKPAAAEVAP